ncbi:hypothetical protein M3221_12010 [Domibacillus indicus]|uniref:hypothetical protein n=1 Tax=Domibacillus indicus TaxID=1437523 RepID=UPI00203D227D|nr:hypothetical protein [Domibacillus indicus]MCM3789128.1 hypothetical protein [Domibacillus indicus]
MLSIHFQDWGKNRPKKHYNRLHEMRIFELIFSEKLNKLGVVLRGFDTIRVYCLANPKKSVSYKEDKALEEMCIFVPDDFMSFLNSKSIEEKFQCFSSLVHSYIVPVLEKYTTLPLPILSSYIEESLAEIVKQNYETVFLIDKTPKKSPSRKKTAILKGIHRSEGFQLRCEVYNERGKRLIDQLLVTEVGNEVVYNRFLGTLRWQTENLIVVKSKSSSWITKIYT